MHNKLRWIPLPYIRLMRYRLTLRSDPAVDLLLGHIQRDGARFKHRVVEASPIMQRREMRVLPLSGWASCRHLLILMVPGVHVLVNNVSEMIAIFV